MKKKKVRIVCGEFRVGDVIEGYKILEFGRSWRGKEVSPSELHSIAYRKCRCGREPIFLSHELCRNCANRIHGEEKKFCYAYLEDEPEKQPSIFKE